MNLSDLALEVLFKDVASGDLESVVKVLDAGVDVNLKHQGKTLLITAANAGKTAIVSALLKEGADVNLRDAENNTALLLACKRNHPGTVRVLVDAPACDVTVKNMQGGFALFFACALKAPHTVRAMLDKGARSQANDMYNNQHCLHIAAQAQDKDTVALLTPLASHVDVVGPGGRTPLHVSCAYSNVDVAATLLRAGANVNARMDNQMTPLHLAVREGRKGLARTLLAFGADINLEDAQGRTPLDIAEATGLASTLLDEPDAGPTPLRPRAPSAHALPPAHAPAIDWKQLKVEDRIGSGGFGVVFKAMYKGYPVAMKKINASDLPADALAEFRHEVSIMSALRHPNIVQLIAASEEPANMAIITELCERRSLYHVIHDPNTKLNKSTKLKMALDAASGMACLHEAGIVHRDLKTLNLLVSSDFTVKVADFGLAKVKSISKSVMTGSIHVMGTLAYMAPELLMGKPFTEKVDVYAFGIVLWEILTRENPFNGMNQDIIFHGVKSGSLKPEIPEGCPTAYADLIHACLRTSPTKRPTFRDVMGALEVMNRRKSVGGRRDMERQSD